MNTPPSKPSVCHAFHALCSPSDGLLVWVHKVIDVTSIGDDSFLTFDPVKQKPALVCYDIQAAAVIIVTMKLLFKLDDRVEWYVSTHQKYIFL